MLLCFVALIIVQPGFYGYTPQSPTVMAYQQGVPATPTSPLIAPVAMVNNHIPNIGRGNRSGK